MRHWKVLNEVGLYPWLLKSLNSTPFSAVWAGQDEAFSKS